MKSSSDQLIHQLSQSCDVKYIVLYTYISCSQALLSYSVNNRDNKEWSTGRFSSLSDDFVENIKDLKGSLPNGSTRLLLDVALENQGLGMQFSNVPIGFFL